MSKLRCLAPRDYCERQKRHGNRKGQPHSIGADLRRKIEIKVERICNLRAALCIQNYQRDKMRVDIIEDDDVDEMADMLDDSDDDGGEIFVPDGLRPNTIEAIDDDIVLIGAVSVGEENLIRTGVQTLEVDNQLSLEYSYTTDVRFLSFK